MKQSLLVMFVGVPGSGKTTFARQLAKKLDAVLLNSDGIRMSMWGSLDAISASHQDIEERKYTNRLTFGAMNYAASQTLGAGYSVVYDCNANHVRERQEKHDIANKHGALSITIRIQVPYETSLHRVQTREEAHDQRKMSLDKARVVIDRFVAEIEEPTPMERVIKISGEASFEEQYAIFERGVELIRERAS